MKSSYLGLLAGLGFAIVLVYLLIVVNFQSWLDPFIIITALPAALAGIVLFLFTTRTTSERSCADGRDYVHGRRHGEQHSGGVVRERTAAASRRRGAGSDRSRRHALPSCLHDRARDDHRHGSDGARRWAKAASRTLRWDAP